MENVKHGFRLARKHWGFVAGSVFGLDEYQVRVKVKLGPPDPDTESLYDGVPIPFGHGDSPHGRRLDRA